MEGTVIYLQLLALHQLYSSHTSKTGLRNVLKFVFLSKIWIFREKIKILSENFLVLSSEPFSFRMILNKYFILFTNFYIQPNVAILHISSTNFVKMTTRYVCNGVIPQS